MNTQTIGDADWLKGTIRYNTKQQQYNYKVRWKNTKPSDNININCPSEDVVPSDI
jgi:hypothetical protein